MNEHQTTDERALNEPNAEGLPFSCPSCGRERWCSDGCYYRASHEPEDCRSCDQLIEERDRAEAYADELANTISELFGVDIGEHSNLNNPWEEAHEVLIAELAKRNSSETNEQETDRQLRSDEILYGSSYCRVDADGKRTRIDPSDIMVKQKPQNTGEDR